MMLMMMGVMMIGMMILRMKIPDPIGGAREVNTARKGEDL